MDFAYSYAYSNDNMEGMIATVVFYLLYSVCAGGFGIALYVLRSLGVYTIAKRRALRNPWFAWIPVLNQFLLGSLSDQYQYVVKGKEKSKRKWLLGLNILCAALYMVFLVMTVGVIFKLIGYAFADYNALKMEKYALQYAMGMLGVTVPLSVIVAVAGVIRYVALYDVYVSLEPKNSVLFIVLSIFFHVTEPFFLFFNRNKDNGMPPRRDPQPVWESAKAEEEPWPNE